MRRWPLSHRLRVADSLCSSLRRSGSGRGPQNVTSLQKGYKRWLLREMVGPRPWTFGGFFWGFRFLEPLAPSKQQQHGSQRLSTRPQSAGCTFPRSLRGRSGEFSCTDTLEALIVVHDGFNYHSQAWSWGDTPWTSTASGYPRTRPCGADERGRGITACLSSLDGAVLSKAAPLSTPFVQQSSTVQRTGIYLNVGFARVCCRRKPFPSRPLSLEREESTSTSYIRGPSSSIGPGFSRYLQ